MTRILRLAIVGSCVSLMAANADAKVKLGQSAVPLPPHNLKIKDITVEECHGLGGVISTAGTACMATCVLVDVDGGVHRVCIKSQ